MRHQRLKCNFLEFLNNLTLSTLLYFCKLSVKVVQVKCPCQCQYSQCPFPCPCHGRCFTKSATWLCCTYNVDVHIIANTCTIFTSITFLSFAPRNSRACDQLHSHVLYSTVGHFTVYFFNMHCYDTVCVSSQLVGMDLVKSWKELSHEVYSY